MTCAVELPHHSSGGITMRSREAQTHVRGARSSPLSSQGRRDILSRLLQWTRPDHGDRGASCLETQLKLVHKPTSGIGASPA
jgi:hypothetical protein